jgi:hypothetical protein
MLLLFVANFSAFAQITERPRPESWKQLVKGAAFKDRFLPMPKGNLSSATWGGANVLPRYIDNGIEDRERSYWGGNIVKGADGSYHLFVCGWPESSPKGHGQWPRSIVYHTVSNNRIGPYTIKDTIGAGHNPEIFQLQDGRYVLYCIDKNYVTNSLDGTWQEGKFEFDPRDRPIIEGLSNLTFAKRPDGSYLMICRGGGVWISQTGLSPYRQVSNKRTYPDVAGEFEDPVVWRDSVQYHMIVNDWLGRIAFYLRSKDGVNWVTDPGEAYVPGIAFHEDGRVEDWFKFERIKILQDAQGRAIQANFAVIDTLKKEDKASDRHSSKNISVPLNPGVLISLMNTSLPAAGETIQVKLSAEKGFNPHTDVELNSLRFGSNEAVNFGKGAKLVGTKKQGRDLLLTFSATGHELTKEEFAPKLIGRYKSGKLLFGYAKVPWVEYEPSILSALRPVFSPGTGTTAISVTVENFGLATSQPATMKLQLQSPEGLKEIAAGTVSPIQPYGKLALQLNTTFPFEKGREYEFVLSLSDADPSAPPFKFKAIPLP